VIKGDFKGAVEQIESHSPQNQRSLKADGIRIAQQMREDQRQLLNDTVEERCWVKFQKVAYSLCILSTNIHIEKSLSNLEAILCMQSELLPNRLGVQCAAENGNYV
jgi:hypothetical protein